jgi:NAD(P)-dependent dehydrogenase (short-subunit alcohol dehydrogenase family)
MKGLLEGKVAVITGAGSGVGRAATLLFTRHGAKVLAADLNFGWAEESAGMARAEGGDARGIKCDVSDEADVTAMVKAAVSEFGRLDVMYNNAGMTLSGTSDGKMKTLTTTSAADIEKVFAVNVNGVLFGCQAAIRQFDAQGGGGAIVNTASLAGLTGYGGVVYGASKGSIVSMTRTLALEVAARGIRVNSVCPGGMLTHFAGLDPDGPQADMIRKHMASTHPLGRVIEPMDCANSALFLASDLASTITGVNLTIDAGLSAGIKINAGT